MNIFAKRKRKSSVEQTESTPAVVAVAGVPDEKKTFESDALVEELLQQDPSTWNAKQRRLIKRYQDRGPQPQPQSLATEQQTTSQLTQDSIIESSGVDLDESTIPVEHSSVNNDETDLEQEPRSDDIIIPGPCSEGTTDESSAHLTVVEQPMSSSGTPQNTSDSTTKEEIGSSTIIDQALHDILNQLNSKQRRKLVRMLERGADLEVVRAQANDQLLLEQTTTSSTISPSPPEPTTLVEPPTKRRRKAAVDLATLAPEERMRREEQRRLQQEAALIRTAAAAVQAANDGATTTVTHKHPLNSERRRANRRKPKWEGGRSFAQQPPNEHDLSGYHMRKITGGKPTPQVT